LCTQTNSVGVIKVKGKIWKKRSNLFDTQPLQQHRTPSKPNATKSSAVAAPCISKREWGPCAKPISREGGGMGQTHWRMGGAGGRQGPHVAYAHTTRWEVEDLAKASQKKKDKKNPPEKRVWLPQWVQQTC